MATLSVLRAAGQPLARAVVRRTAGLDSPSRHPLVPAAVRVERSKSRRSGEVAEQTALTLWFGSGPELPGPQLSRSPWRVAAGLGMTLAGAVALAAASTVAAHREEARRISAARPVRALPVSTSIEVESLSS